MNLDELRAVQIDERGTDSVQPLPDSFYRDVAAYLDELRRERNRAAREADDPFESDRVRRLSDEIETAEDVVEAIYERRVGKVVKRASLAASGLAADDEGLTDEEAALFDDLVDRIESNRREVLEEIETGSTTPPDVMTPETSADRGQDDDPADDLAAGDVMGETQSNGTPAGDVDATAAGDEAVDGSDGAEGPGSAGDADASTDDGSPDRVTVRITRDVGEIFGVDERVYDLGKEDVVTLPRENATPLIERDAAQRLD